MMIWPLKEDKVVSPARKKLPEAPTQKGMSDFLQQFQDLIEEDYSSMVNHWVEEVTARVAYV